MSDNDTTLKGLINIIECAYKKYLKAFNLRECEVLRDKHIMADVIDRYRKDEERLKKFHPDMDRIDAHKQVAYLTYWLCKLKPFRCEVTAYRKHRPSKLVNELISLLLSVPRLQVQGGVPRSFVKPFLYSLHWRRIEPDFLSIIYYFLDVYHEPGKISSLA